MRHISRVTCSLRFCILVAGCAEALLGTPVFLFGELAQGPSRVPATGATTQLAELKQQITSLTGLMMSIARAYVPPSQQATGAPAANLERRLVETAAGEELFVQLCATCHGPRGGGGRGPSLLGGRQVQLMRRPTDQELFNLIRKGIPGTEMPPFPLPDQQIWELVAFVRGLNAPAIESTVVGNVEVGQAIFFGKGACTNCHMIRGEDGFLGPDLSDVGLRRTLNQLREAVLEPDTEIVAGFQGVTVTRSDGQRIEGIAKNNDNYSIQILDAQGRLHLLLKKSLEKVVLREKSLMPGDYDRRLTAKEIEDLLAFLSRQSLRPVSTR